MIYKNNVCNFFSTNWQKFAYFVCVISIIWTEIHSDFKNVHAFENIGKMDAKTTKNRETGNDTKCRDFGQFPDFSRHDEKSRDTQLANRTYRFEWRITVSLILAFHILSYQLVIINYISIYTEHRGFAVNYETFFLHRIEKFPICVEKISMNKIKFEFKKTLFW